MNLSDSDDPTFDDFMASCLEEEREEKEMEVSLSSQVPQKGNWVLARFPMKTKVVYYVGKIVGISGDGDPTVDFLRRYRKATNDSTFIWPQTQDQSEIPANDIECVLPEPQFGRRGEVQFSVSFASYNIQ